MDKERVDDFQYLVGSSVRGLTRAQLREVCLKFWLLLQDVEIRMLPVRVVRSRPEFQYRDCDCFDGRYLVLPARLTSKGAELSVVVDNPQALGLWREEEGVFNDGHSLALYDMLRQAAGEKGDVRILGIENLTRAVSIHATDKWYQARTRYREAFEQMRRNAREHIRRHIEKSGSKERSVLQKKLAAFMEKTPGLLDADARAVAALFRLSPAEVKLLSGFLKRNAADASIARPEDVTEAQKIARVSEVMKS